MKIINTVIYALASGTLILSSTCWSEQTTMIRALANTLQIHPPSGVVALPAGSHSDWFAENMPGPGSLIHPEKEKQDREKLQGQIKPKPIREQRLDNNKTKLPSVFSPLTTEETETSDEDNNKWLEDSGNEKERSAYYYKEAEAFREQKKKKASSPFVNGKDSDEQGADLLASHYSAQRQTNTIHGPAVHKTYGSIIPGMLFFMDNKPDGTTNSNKEGTGSQGGYSSEDNNVRDSQPVGSEAFSDTRSEDITPTHNISLKNKYRKVNSEHLFNGENFIIGFSKKHTTIWNTSKKGELKKEITLSQSHKRASEKNVSHDGKRIALIRSHGMNIDVVDNVQGESSQPEATWVQSTIENNYPASSLEFNPVRSDEILIFDEDGAALLKYNSDEQWSKSLLEGSTHCSTGGYTSDGENIVIISYPDSNLTIYNTDESGERHLAQTINLPETAVKVFFSPAEKLFFYVMGSDVSTDLSSGRSVSDYTVGSCYFNGESWVKNDRIGKIDGAVMALNFSHNGNDCIISSHNKKFVFKKDCDGNWKEQPFMNLHKFCSLNPYQLGSPFTPDDNEVVFIRYPDELYIHKKDEEGRWTDTAGPCFSTKPAKLDLSSNWAEFSPDGNRALFVSKGRIMILEKQANGSWDRIIEESNAFFLSAKFYQDEDHILMVTPKELMIYEIKNLISGSYR